MKQFRRGRSSSEAGETLVEVVMATALMGLAVVTIIGGFATMLLGSKLHRDQADGNRSLVMAMETLKSPDVARKCAANDSSHPYRTLAALPSTIAIQTIEYEKIVRDLSGNPSVTWSPSQADCDLTSAATLQRITLLYTSPDSKVTPSMSFIKGQY